MGNSSENCHLYSRIIAANKEEISDCGLRISDCDAEASSPVQRRMYAERDPNTPDSAGVLPFNLPAGRQVRNPQSEMAGLFLAFGQPIRYTYHYDKRG